MSQNLIINRDDKPQLDKDIPLYYVFHPENDIEDYPGTIDSIRAQGFFNIKEIPHVVRQEIEAKRYDFEPYVNDTGVFKDPDRFITEWYTFISILKKIRASKKDSIITKLGSKPNRGEIRTIPSPVDLVKKKFWIIGFDRVWREPAATVGLYIQHRIANQWVAELCPKEKPDHKPFDRPVDKWVQLKWYEYIEDELGDISMQRRLRTGFRSNFFMFKYRREDSKEIS